MREPRVVIIGGGHVGLTLALRLQKKLDDGEARVTVIDTQPHMTYQPFLPEAAAGSLEPRHVVVPLREALRRCEVLTGLAVSGVATASLGFTTSVPMFLAASLIAGMGAGVLNPAQNAAVADLIGSNRRGGTVLATFQHAADLGAILGPLIAGALADTVSYQAAFLVTGATAALGLLAWVRAPETRPQPEPGEAQVRAAA